MTVKTIFKWYLVICISWGNTQHYGNFSQFQRCGNLWKWLDITKAQVRAHITLKTKPNLRKAISQTRLDCEQSLFCSRTQKNVNVHAVMLSRSLVLQLPWFWRQEIFRISERERARYCCWRYKSRALMWWDKSVAVLKRYLRGATARRGIHHDPISSASFISHSPIISTAK